MNPNGIIDKDLKILLSSNCNSDIAQNNNIDFVASDESDRIMSQKDPGQNQINVPVIENTFTVNIHFPLDSNKFCEITAKMITMKSFFMNEIDKLINKLILLQSRYERNESKEPKSHLRSVLERCNCYKSRYTKINKSSEIE